MSTPKSLVEDVRFFLKKLAFLDGRDLRTICRSLGLPVTNMGASDMAEQVTGLVRPALEAYAAMPSRETELVLKRFRYHLLLDSAFLERFLAGIKRAGTE